ncbi:hypothetical protein [Shewanella marina]|uniref:hypothetical protein n=1 Tax=Shewanella marina TaxID=487319 RepID=UPI00046F6038|nr:hypothetical protein [Shewanella marina]
MAVQQAQIAWQKLAPALGADLRIIQSEVAQGVAQLFVWGGEYYTVLRAEDTELVIVAGAGKNAAQYTAEIHLLAKRQGFKTVRLHTKKPDAMLRLGAKKLGYQAQETILRAVL